MSGKICTYQKKQLVQNGLFASVLFAFSGLLLWGSNFHILSWFICLCLYPILLLFGLDLLLKYNTSFTYTEDSITRTLFRKQTHLPLTEVTDVRLKYYQPRKSCSGWMELTLRSQTQKCLITSELSPENAFEDMVHLCFQAILKNDLSIDRVTEHNFAAFGLFRGTETAQTADIS